MPVELAVVGTELVIGRGVSAKLVPKGILKFPGCIAVSFIDEKLIAPVREAHVIDSDCALW